MKKILSLFQRNYETDRLVRDEVVPGAEWVLAGEGVATRKWDGTSCLVREGKLYKRYELKKGKTPPDGFDPAQGEDATTGDCPGWVPVGDGPEDAYHREALEYGQAVCDQAGTFGRVERLVDGTYELCGPKVQGNPDGFARHCLVAHGKAIVNDCPRDFNGIRAYLEPLTIEGIVWHHPDGRMVKIKRKDFFKKQR